MNQLEKFKEIETFIFDVDGVLTNSEVLVMENGQLLRKMNIRDGYAIKKAIKEGYRVAIITGGKSEGVKQRLKDLGVTDIYSGVEDKLEAYEELVYTYDLDEGTILYMGDDLPDYGVLRRVGLACVPQDACPDLFSIAQYVSPKSGGNGCARDVIEKVLRLNEKWSEE